MQPRKDPYAAPTSRVGEVTPPPPPVRIGRILVWGMLIFVSAMAIYLVSGFTMANWEIYGSTMEQAVVNARWVRRIVAWVVGYGLYLMFLRGTTGRHLLQALAVFIVVQFIDVVTSILVFKVYDDFFDWAGMGRSLLICLLAYGTWFLFMSGARRVTTTLDR